METIRPAGAQVDAAFRHWLLSYLEAYLANGNAALVEYQDRADVVRLGEEFRSMLDARPSLTDLAPEFYNYLAQYPAAPPPNVSDFLYWSKESFGLKPVISVTHASIYRLPGQAIVASKQVYANHYFDGSLGLTFLLDKPADSGVSLYIVYLNRSRIDLLGGHRGGLRRFFRRRSLLDGFKQNLRDVVMRLGSSCQKPAASVSQIPVGRVGRSKGRTCRPRVVGKASAPP
jgi:hypothetical protein